MAYERNNDGITSMGRPLPIRDMWLVVDEEQTLKLGMRRTWRWLEDARPASEQMRCSAGTGGSVTMPSAHM